MAPTKIRSFMRSLLHVFTELRVNLIHAQNNNDPYDDEFTHKTELNVALNLVATLVKLPRKGVKKTLTLAGRRLRYPGKNKIDTNTNTGIRIGRANFQM